LPPVFLEPTALETNCAIIPNFSDSSAENEFGKKSKALSRAVYIIIGAYHFCSKNRREASLTKLLLIDDDISLCRLLKIFLESNGMEADCVHNAKDALLRLREQCHSCDARAYDMLVLDVVMPDENGIDELRAIRAASIDIPVVMLTGSGDSSDKIAALNSGADDYVCKPFEPDELLARINAVLRRSGKKAHNLEADAKFHAGDIEIDGTARTARFLSTDEVVDLTDIESRLLEMLARNAGGFVSLEKLLACIWGNKYSSNSRNLSQYISRLRRKLGSYPCGTGRIKTFYGKGFMYVLPPAAEKMALE